MSERSRAAGFTLIEMLVVIGIIVVLAAVTLPIIGNARAKAQQTNCLSNQHQLAQHLLLLAEENKDTFPVGLTAWTADATVSKLTCGATNGRFPYMVNGRVDAMPVSRLEDPARTALFVEGIGKEQIVNNEQELLLDYRHRDRMVVGYADGHADLADIYGLDLYFYGDELVTQPDVYEKFSFNIIAEGWSYPREYDIIQAKPEQIAEYLPQFIATLGLYPSHAMTRHLDGAAQHTPFFQQIVLYRVKPNVPQPRIPPIKVIDGTVYLEVHMPDSVHSAFCICCWQETTPGFQMTYLDAVHNPAAAYERALHDAAFKQTWDAMRASLVRYCPHLDDAFWRAVRLRRHAGTGSGVEALPL